MTLIFADRVKETTSTTGVNAVTLAGAVQQYQTFANGIGPQNSCYYCILSGNAVDWEVGQGTVSANAPYTLSRDIIFASTNGGSAINLTGTSTVFCDAPAHFLNSLLGVSGVLLTVEENTSFSANPGFRYLVDTMSGPVTATVDPTPGLNDTIGFGDATGHFGTHNLTVDWNGKNFQGSSNNTVMQIGYQFLTAQFTGSQWVPIG